MKLKICGRILYQQDIELIRSVIRANWSNGRKHISKELCYIWDWKQANGYLRDMQCRSLLLKLEQSGLIQLPPYLRRRDYTRHNRNRKPKICIPEVNTEPIVGEVKDYKSNIHLVMVKRTEQEPIWNYYIQKYHYLGCSFIIGSNLKYIAYLDNRPIACTGWGSPLLALDCRDKWIGWSSEVRKKNLRYIVNNWRYLILPWVRLKHLASMLLGMNIKVLAGDWLKIHGHKIYLLETLVDRERFKGTTYKASNWTCVGQTRGMTKKGNKYFYHGRIKDVYVYPLNKDWHEQLLSGGSA